MYMDNDKFYLKDKEKYPKKVSVKYSCGHGSHYIGVGGFDPKDDASRVSWFEHNVCCGNCFIKNRDGVHTKFEDDTLEPTISCNYEVIDNIPYLKFIATGQLNINKDKLKGIGFRWDKSSAINERTKKEYSKWIMVYYFKIFSLKEMQEFLSKFRPLIESTGYKLYTDMFEMTMTDIQKDIDTFKSKLKYNGCYDFMKKKHGIIWFNSWNGKIYGSKGNKSYYINNQKYSISDEQAEEILEFENNL